MDPLRAMILWASENERLRSQLPRYRSVRSAVRRFMPGETPEDALAAAGRLAQDGIAATFTVLGERVLDQAQATATADEYLRLLDRIEDLGIDGEVSVKLTQLGFEQDPQLCRELVAHLADRSARSSRTLWIDMEHAGIVDGTIDLYEDLMLEGRDVGLCLQAYLKRTWDDVQRLLPNRPSIRLVKGAYREPTSIAFAGQRAIDEAFLRLATHLVRDTPNAVRRTVLGTHDVALLRRIERAAGGGDAARFEVAMLFGIRPDEQRRLAHEGYAVRTLISFGDHWYPWFMRRIAEKPVQNTILALRNLAP